MKQVKPGFTNYQPRGLPKGFEIPLKSFEKLQKNSKMSKKNWQNWGEILNFIANLKKFHNFH